MFHREHFGQYRDALKTIIYTILEQSSDKKGDSAGMQVSISRNSLKGTRIVIPCKQI
jgi:hypothetical protein